MQAVLGGGPLKEGCISILGVPAAEHPQLPLPSLHRAQMESQRLQATAASSVGTTSQ